MLTPPARSESGIQTLPLLQSSIHFFKVLLRSRTVGRYYLEGYSEMVVKRQHFILPNYPSSSSS